MLENNHNGTHTPNGVSDPELTEGPKRRTFTAQYKLKILQEADSASTPGAVGALCRSQVE